MCRPKYTGHSRGGGGLGANEGRGLRGHREIGMVVGGGGGGVQE